MTRGWVFFLGLVFFTITASAKEMKLPPLLQAVEARYAQAPTVQADFAQVDYIAALNREKKSSGVFLAKKPNKVRWETTAPDVNLLVSDGHRFWFYTPPFDSTEHGQVIERKTAQIQSKFAQALLSGKFSAIRGKIEDQGGNRFLLTLSPGSAGDIEKAEVRIDPKQKLIAQVKLFHSDGNRSEIALSKFELGYQMDDQLFYFVPPPGTIQVRD
jgi:outer membrane lipoprotein carrier protein